jgi:lipopolysaccharide transport system ATP-binding protein
LEVGTGFHAELTGRENIFLNGAILGMTKREIALKLDEIIAFSEVEQFVDTPVKRYSSGMYVRLAFAVAAHLEPEILIVDEVLAVGDAAFQRKCLGKMGEVAQGGRTVLFVSHNMGSIESLCGRVLVLDQGEIVADTNVRAGITKYLSRFEIDECETRDTGEIPRPASMQPVLRRVQILNDGGQPAGAVSAGGGLCLEIDYVDPGGVLTGAQFGITIDTPSGVHVLSAGTRYQLREPLQLGDRGRVECRIPSLPLVPGLYQVSVSCYTNTRIIDRLEHVRRFNVVGSDFFGTGRLPRPGYSLVLVNAEWREAQSEPRGSSPS